MKQPNEVILGNSSRGAADVGSEAGKNYSSSIGIWIGLAVYYALAISHFSYIPLWDSLENLEEYLFLPRQHFYFYNLLMMHNGHPSLGYFWPFWIGQWLFPSQMLMIHIINVMIGSLAIVAFGRIAAIAFQGMAGKREIALLTIAFAVQPVFVAYSVNMSPDYGILAYFLATLWLLYSGRTGWAAITGVMLLFSKEIGVPTYMLLVVFYLGGAIRKYRWREVWPLAIPLLTFGVYCFYQRYKERPIFPWAARWLNHETIWQTYLPNLLKPDFKMACLGPFVLEFQWIFTAVILAGLAAGIFARLPARAGLAEIKNWFRGINLPLRSFIFLMLGCLYVDSRTVVFTNQRYFFALYPLVLLASFAAILQLKVKEKFRTVLLTGSILLLLACNFRTFDPVSRKIAGTFGFGSHHLLSIATIRPDVGDCNRDEMVYNLEHTHFSGLLDLAFAKIQPTDQTTIVMANNAWWVMSRLDSRTWHRTESTRSPYIKPIHLIPEDIARMENKPETVYIVAPPNLDNKTIFLQLNPYYELKERDIFTEDGYELQVWKMIKRHAMTNREILSLPPFTSLPLASSSRVCERCLVSP
ncbi:MAG: hypothetical protein WCD79_08340 [Chthoniobacteraceae bacterium]